MKSERSNRIVWVALVVYTVATAILTVLVMQAAGGTLGYTLDDPYIHLAVAENIVEHGVYGVNPGEVAAPSSSILWPLLLVPFVAMGLDPAVAFVLNVVFAVLAVVAMGRIVCRVFGAEWLGGAVMVAWLFGTNVIGVAFTGMEHTLQIAFAAFAAWGAGRTVWRGEVDPWLWAVLAAGPWIRYECLSVTVPLLGWLFLRGNRLGAVLTGLLSVSVLAAFSGFLLSNDLGVLPSSVVAKSMHIEENGGLMGLVGNFLHNLLDWEGALLLLLSFGALGAGLGAEDRERRWLGFAAAASGLLHLTFGRLGWFHRYEVYLVAYLWAAIFIVGGRDIRTWCDGARWRGAALAVFIAGLGWSYIVGLVQIPGASANIWGQQHQLHRLVADHVDEPVGVNDLGWTTYGNDDFVYDFLGLGSYRSVQHLRADDPTTIWMDEVAGEYQIRLLIVSEFFFPQVPPKWKRIGQLCLHAPAVTVAAGEVTLFARRPEDAAELRGVIDDWADDLPPIATFEPDGCE